jgi:Flp pilus assembly protein CpaB
MPTTLSPPREPLVSADDGAGLAPPRRRLLARVPTTLILAVAAGLLAMVLYFGATASRSVSVLVAGRDIQAGERLDPTDLRPASVSASPPVLATLLRPGEVSDADELVAGRTMAAGSLVARGDLVEAGGEGGPRAMSIPVDAEHAVGGQLKPGDRVDVIDATGPAYVLADAEVLGVARPAKGALSPGRSHAVTVAVDPESALRLAAAIRGGKVEVVRATAAPPIALGPAPSSTPPTTAPSG